MQFRYRRHKTSVENVALLTDNVLRQLVISLKVTGDLAPLESVIYYRTETLPL